MYYLPYEQKILKIARIRDQIYRFRFLILGILLAILSAIMALLAVKGNIVNDISLQPAYVYGERIKLNANAFLSGVEYEYFAGTWTSEQPKRPGEYSIRVKAKARSRMVEQPAWVYPMENGDVRVAFDEPQRAITPGQAVVLYDGDLVVGGGIITTVLRD